MFYFALQIESPTIEKWRQIIKTETSQLLDTTVEMQVLLAFTQADVEQQFDENQSKWKANARFTKNKKERNGKDLRIMHETKTKGKRLRDKYRQTGRVTEDGRMIYFYPPDKKYAKLLQKGGSVRTIRNKRANTRNGEISDNLDFGDSLL